MTAVRPTPPVQAVITALRLALRESLHEWRLSLCLVLGLAAVLAPLLVLFGLKSGIIEGMRQRLMADPHTLELLVVGSYRLEPQWFASLAQDPMTGFVTPRTRSLSAQVDLQGPAGRGRKALTGVEMIPTAEGDPLLRDATGHAVAAPHTVTVPQGAGAAGALIPASEAILSATAAASLGVVPGDQMIAFIRRTLNGQQQVERLEITVSAVLPESAFGRDGIFVPLAFLAATEDYRDGRDGQDGRPNAPGITERAYASARIFASSLDAVAPLAERLRQKGLEVRTKASEIATLKALDHSLTVIFALVAGLAAGGYALSLAVSLWAHVDRKRKDLAMLRLIGLRPFAVLLFPVAQGVAIALCGAVLSGLLAFGVAALINATLASGLGDSDFVCLLRPQDVASAVVGTALVAVLASLMGGTRAARIDPAESLREV